MGGHSDEQNSWQEFASRSTVIVVLESGFVFLLMVLALVGNLLVCVAVCRNPRLRSASNYYIISLALSDILQATFSMPLSFGMLVTGKWPFTTGGCYFAAISKFSLAEVSVYTMTLMGLNRYFKIVRPTKYQTFFNKKFVILSASIVWIVFCFAGILVTLVLDYNTRPHPGFAICFQEYDTPSLPGFLVVTQFPYLILFFCYFSIYLFVKKHNSNVTWQSSNVENVKIAKTLFLTVIAFAILWLPAHLTFGIYLRKGVFSIPRQLSYTISLLVYFSSCANPFIYGYMNRNFKKEFQKMLCVKKAHSVETTPS